MTQEDRVRAALSAWLDYFPWPETWTGELQRRATTSGPAPFRRVSCPTCHGRGKLRGGWICQDCEGRGVYHVDAYTEKPVDTFDTPFADLLKTVTRCSRCAGTNVRCSRCNGKGVEAALFSGKADMTGGAVDRARQDRQGDRVLDQFDQAHTRRDQVACYRDHLVPAMRLLHASDRPAHFAVSWTLVWQQQPERTLLPTARLSLDRGLRFLGGAVPTPLVLPYEVLVAWEERQKALAAARGKKAARSAQRARNDEIRRQHAAGTPVTRLAEAWGLNKGQVSRIVNGLTAT